MVLESQTSETRSIVPRKRPVEAENLLVVLKEALDAMRELRTYSSEITPTTPRTKESVQAEIRGLLQMLDQLEQEPTVFKERFGVPIANIRRILEEGLTERNVNKAWEKAVKAESQMEELMLFFQASVDAMEHGIPDKLAINGMSPEETFTALMSAATLALDNIGGKYDERARMILTLYERMIAGFDLCIIDDDAITKTFQNTTDLILRLATDMQNGVRYSAGVLAWYRDEGVKKLVANFDELAAQTVPILQAEFTGWLGIPQPNVDGLSKKDAQSVLETYQTWHAEVERLLKQLKERSVLPTYEEYAGVVNGYYTMVGREDLAIERSKRETLYEEATFLRGTKDEREITEGSMEWFGLHALQALDEGNDQIARLCILTGKVTFHSGNKPEKYIPSYAEIVALVRDEVTPNADQFRAYRTELESANILAQADAVVASLPAGRGVEVSRVRKAAEQIRTLINERGEDVDIAQNLEHAEILLGMTNGYIDTLERTGRGSKAVTELGALLDRQMNSEDVSNQFETARKRLDYETRAELITREISETNWGSGLLVQKGVVNRALETAARLAENQETLVDALELLRLTQGYVGTVTLLLTRKQGRAPSLGTEESAALRGMERAIGAIVGTDGVNRMGEAEIETIYDDSYNAANGIYIRKEVAGFRSLAQERPVGRDDVLAALDEVERRVDAKKTGDAYVMLSFVQDFYGAEIAATAASKNRPAIEKVAEGWLYRVITAEGEAGRTEIDDGKNMMLEAMRLEIGATTSMQHSTAYERFVGGEMTVQLYDGYYTLKAEYDERLAGMETAIQLNGKPLSAILEDMRNAAASGDYLRYNAAVDAYYARRKDVVDRATTLYQGSIEANLRTIGEEFPSLVGMLDAPQEDRNGVSVEYIRGENGKIQRRETTEVPEAQTRVWTGDPGYVGSRISETRTTPAHTHVDTYDFNLPAPTTMPAEQGVGTRLFGTLQSTPDTQQGERIKNEVYGLEQRRLDLLSKWERVKKGGYDAATFDTEYSQFLSDVKKWERIAYAYQVFNIEFTSTFEYWKYVVSKAGAIIEPSQAVQDTIDLLGESYRLFENARNLLLSGDFAQAEQQYNLAIAKRIEALERYGTEAEEFHSSEGRNPHISDWRRGEIRREERDITRTRAQMYRSRSAQYKVYSEVHATTVHEILFGEYDETRSTRLEANRQPLEAMRSIDRLMFNVSARSNSGVDFAVQQGLARENLVSAVGAYRAGNRADGERYLQDASTSIREMQQRCSDMEFVRMIGYTGVALGAALVGQPEISYLLIVGPMVGEGVRELKTEGRVSVGTVALIGATTLLFGFGEAVAYYRSAKEAAILIYDFAAVDRAKSALRFFIPTTRWGGYAFSGYMLYEADQALRAGDIRSAIFNTMLVAVPHAVGKGLELRQARINRMLEDMAPRLDRAVVNTEALGMPENPRVTALRDPQRLGGFVREYAAYDSATPEGRQARAEMTAGMPNRVIAAVDQLARQPNLLVADLEGAIALFDIPATARTPTPGGGNWYERAADWTRDRNAMRDFAEKARRGGQEAVQLAEMRTTNPELARIVDDLIRTGDVDGAAASLREVVERNRVGNLTALDEKGQLAIADRRADISESATRTRAVAEPRDGGPIARVEVLEDARTGRTELRYERNRDRLCEEVVESVTEAVVEDVQGQVTPREARRVVPYVGNGLREMTPDGRTIEGRQEPWSNRIELENAGNRHSAVHEFFHFLASRFGGNIATFEYDGQAYAINDAAALREGLTEWRTRRVCERRGYQYDRNHYQRETGLIERLQEAGVSDGALNHAQLTGDFSRVCSEFDAMYGRGAFADVVGRGNIGDMRSTLERRVSGEIDPRLADINETLGRHVSSDVRGVEARPIENLNVEPPSGDNIIPLPQQGLRGRMAARRAATAAEQGRLEGIRRSHEASARAAEDARRNQTPTRDQQPRLGSETVAARAKQLEAMLERAGTGNTELDARIIKMFEDLYEASKQKGANREAIYKLMEKFIARENVRLMLQANEGAQHPMLHDAVSIAEIEAMKRGRTGSTEGLTTHQDPRTVRYRNLIDQGFDQSDIETIGRVAENSSRQPGGKPPSKIREDASKEYVRAEQRRLVAERKLGNASLLRFVENANRTISELETLLARLEADGHTTVTIIEKGQTREISIAEVRTMLNDARTQLTELDAMPPTAFSERRMVRNKIHPGIDKVVSNRIDRIMSSITSANWWVSTCAAVNGVQGMQRPNIILLEATQKEWTVPSRERLNLEAESRTERAKMRTASRTISSTENQPLARTNEFYTGDAANGGTSQRIRAEEMVFSATTIEARDRAADSATSLRSTTQREIREVGTGTQLAETVKEQIARRAAQGGDVNAVVMDALRSNEALAAADETGYGAQYRRAVSGEKVDESLKRWNEGNPSETRTREQHLQILAEEGNLQANLELARRDDPNITEAAEAARIISEIDQGLKNLVTTVIAGQADNLAALGIYAPVVADVSARSSPETTPYGTRRARAWAWTRTTAGGMRDAWGNWWNRSRIENEQLIDAGGQATQRPAIFTRNRVILGGLAILTLGAYPTYRFITSRAEINEGTEYMETSFGVSPSTTNAMRVNEEDIRTVLDRWKQLPKTRAELMSLANEMMPKLEGIRGNIALITSGEKASAQLLTLVGNDSGIRTSLINLASNPEWTTNAAGLVRNIAPNLDGNGVANAIRYVNMIKAGVDAKAGLSKLLVAWGINPTAIDQLKTGEITVGTLMDLVGGNGMFIHPKMWNAALTDIIDMKDNLENLRTWLAQEASRKISTSDRANLEALLGRWGLTLSDVKEAAQRKGGADKLELSDLVQLEMTRTGGWYTRGIVRSYSKEFVESFLYDCGVVDREAQRKLFGLGGSGREVYEAVRTMVGNGEVALAMVPVALEMLAAPGVVDELNRKSERWTTSISDAVRWFMEENSLTMTTPVRLDKATAAQRVADVDQLLGGITSRVPGIAGIDYQAVVVGFQNQDKDILVGLWQLINSGELPVVYAERAIYYLMEPMSASDQTPKGVAEVRARVDEGIAVTDALREYLIGKNCIMTTASADAPINEKVGKVIRFDTGILFGRLDDQAAQNHMWMASTREYFDAARANPARLVTPFNVVQIGTTNTVYGATISAENREIIQNPQTFTEWMTATTPVDLIGDARRAGYIGNAALVVIDPNIRDRYDLIAFLNKHEPLLQWILSKHVEGYQIDLVSLLTTLRSMETVVAAAEIPEANMTISKSFAAKFEPTGATLIREDADGSEPIIRAAEPHGRGMTITSGSDVSGWQTWYQSELHPQNIRGIGPVARPTNVPGEQPAQESQTAIISRYFDSGPGVLVGDMLRATLNPADKNSKEYKKIKIGLDRIGGVDAALTRLETALYSMITSNSSGLAGIGITTTPSVDVTDPIKFTGWINGTLSSAQR